MRASWLASVASIAMFMYPSRQARIPASWRWYERTRYCASTIAEHWDVVLSITPIIYAAIQLHNDWLSLNSPQKVCWRLRT